jgi:hypothetical protein
MQVEITGSATFDGRAPAYNNPDNVTVDVGATLTLRGLIINSGSIKLQIYAIDIHQFPESPGQIVIDGSVLLQGGGSVDLFTGTYSTLIVGLGTAPVLRNVDNTVVGSGIIGSPDLTLVNQKGGTFYGIAEIDTGAHTIFNAGLFQGVFSFDSPVSNSGVIKETGDLSFLSDIGGSGGILEADDSATVTITGLVNTAGGLMQSFGTGTFVLDGGTVGGGTAVAQGTQIDVRTGEFDGRAPAFSNAGSATVTAGHQLSLRGTIINTGSISLIGEYLQPADLLIAGDVTLKGGGQIELQNPNNVTDLTMNHIAGSGAGPAILRNVDNVISGTGTIGSGDSLTLANEKNGVIDATQGNSQTLGILIDTGANTIINAGLMESTAFGNRLTIAGSIKNTGTILASGNSNVLFKFKANSVINNVGGTIKAMDFGSHVDIHNTLIGGVLVAGPKAEITLWDGARIVGATIAAGTTVGVDNAIFDGRAPVFNNAGNVSAAFLTLEGAINNTGTIIDDFTGHILIDGNVTLEGHGKVELTSNPNQPATSYIQDANPGGFLRNVDNTIYGTGIISGDLSLLNDKSGVIVSNAAPMQVSNDSNAPLIGISIDTGSHTIINKGLLEATHGGLVEVKGAINNSGTIEAFANSAVHLDSSLNNTGALIADGGSIVVSGGISGAGKAVMHSGGSIEFEGAALEHVSFGGAGKLLLDAAASFHGDVNGFGANDTIDFGDIAFGAHTTLAFISNMAGNGGLLRVSDGTHNAAITLVGSYTTASFAKQDDNGHLSVIAASAV